MSGKGKREWDAVRRSGQCIHSEVKPGRRWEAVQGQHRWCSPASVREEEERLVGPGGPKD
jgi:hypothetical protein